MTDLDALERLLAKANEYLPLNRGGTLTGIFDDHMEPVAEAEDSRVTADLIVAAVNALPALLREIRELRVADRGPALLAARMFADSLGHRVSVLEAVLRAIVAEDYRGNEPNWYRQARAALEARHE